MMTTVSGLLVAGVLMLVVMLLGDARVAATGRQDDSLTTMPITYPRYGNRRGQQQRAPDARTSSAMVGRVREEDREADDSRREEETRSEVRAVGGGEEVRRGGRGKRREERGNDVILVGEEGAGEERREGEERSREDRGGSCEDIRNLHSAVVRLLNDQYERDRRIHEMQGKIGALESDVTKLRDQMEKLLDKETSRNSRESPTPKHSLSHDKHSRSGKIHSSSRNGTHEASSLPSSSKPSNTLSAVNTRLDNLTLTLDLQGHHLEKLEKRLRSMKHAHVATSASSAEVSSRNLTGNGKVERSIKTGLPKSQDFREGERRREDDHRNERKREEDADKKRKREEERQREREQERLLMSRCEREMMVARELTTKQRVINANVQRKMQHLEKILVEKIQEDDPGEDDESISNRRLQNGHCPAGFVRHLSSCYLFENTTANWINAEKRCQTLNPNAHLVSIDNADEEYFLLQYRSYNAVRWSSRYMWIGANDMAAEGRWAWVATGSEVLYTNWRTGEPSNFRGDQHCAYLHTTEANGSTTGATWTGGQGSGAGRWDDWHCHSTKINFVCEIVIV